MRKIAAVCISLFCLSCAPLAESNSETSAKSVTNYNKEITPEESFGTSTPAFNTSSNAPTFNTTQNTNTTLVKNESILAAENKINPAMPLSQTLELSDNLDYEVESGNNSNSNSNSDHDGLTLTPPSEPSYNRDATQKQRVEAAETRARKIELHLTMISDEEAATYDTNDTVPSVLKIARAKASPRFGYTIQLAAARTSDEFDSYLKLVPRTLEPVWENKKIVNGVLWNTLLYGDYGSLEKATAAIVTLPDGYHQLTPFVKSVDSIKSSPYPKMKKLR